jgi:hypothetical protein
VDFPVMARTNGTRWHFTEALRINQMPPLAERKATLPVTYFCPDPQPRSQFSARAPGWPARPRGASKCRWEKMGLVGSFTKGLSPAWFKRGSHSGLPWGQARKGAAPRSETGALGARWLQPTRPQTPSFCHHAGADLEPRPQPHLRGKNKTRRDILAGPLSHVGDAAPARRSGDPCMQKPRCAVPLFYLIYTICADPPISLKRLRRFGA